jgi:3-oxoacid CoA-transferase subunit B
MPLTREQIAQRVARELQDGFYVNLGIGMPTLVANYVPPGIEVVLQSENGMLGVGPYPREDEIDPDLINAGKETVTEIAGTAYFSSAESFAMIRGGHLDVAVLGALQVSAAGDIANWAVPGRNVLGVGGAMDLVVGARRVIVTMTATTGEGEPKVVLECTLPLTARGVADVVITELSVFRIRDGSLQLTELFDGVTLEDVRRTTAAPFEVALEAGAR